MPSWLPPLQDDVGAQTWILIAHVPKAGHAAGGGESKI